jgi:hypothetical protein
MKSTLLALPLAAFAVASASWSTSAAAPGAADTIATVDYTFRDIPMNSMGVKSFADLRGKPVIIDFWGKN